MPHAASVPRTAPSAARQTAMVAVAAAGRYTAATSTGKFRISAPVMACRCLKVLLLWWGCADSQPGRLESLVGATCEIAEHFVRRWRCDSERTHNPSPPTRQARRQPSLKLAQPGAGQCERRTT